MPKPTVRRKRETNREGGKRRESFGVKKGSLFCNHLGLSGRLFDFEKAGKGNALGWGTVNVCS